MKVALCLYGQPRFYNSASYECLKKEIRDKYDTDIFIHTWFKKDFKFTCAPWSYLGEVVMPDNTVSDIIELYKPKKIVVDEPGSIDFSEYDQPITGDPKNDYLTKNMPQMFYSIYKSHSLMKEYAEENNIKYDFVIKARLDTVVYNLPDFKEFKEGVIYVPHMDFLHSRGLITDNFSISDYEIALRISEIYLQLKKYNYCSYSPESTVSDFCRSNNIITCGMNFQVGLSRKWQK